MHWFSASQVDTYRLCKRKWAWQKLAGLDAPPGPAAALGSATHAQLEGWLRDGKPLDLLSEPGQIAMSGLHHLPAPRTSGLEVEQKFAFTLGGHPFRGAIDWQLLDRRPPLVGDHKTTKDFRWAKTPEDLLVDTQATLYATAIMYATGSHVADLQWTYFRTTGARASKVVHLRVTAKEIEPTLERTVRAADEMSLILRAGVRAEEVPINAGSCEAFGGCPYQSKCNLTPEEKFKAMMNQQVTSDFLTQMQQRARTGAPPGAINPPESAAALPPGPPPTPVQNPVTGAWELPAPPAAPPPAAPAQPIWDGYRQLWCSQDGTPLPGQAAPQAPPAAQPAYSSQAGPAAAPPVAPAEQPAPRRRGPGRPKGSAATVQAPGAPAQPMQATPPDQQAEDDDLPSKVATLLRQASSLVLTAAAIVEEL